MNELFNKIRESEILRVRPLFAPRSHLLELGGSDGFQARLLADGGHDVVSIDIPNRARRQTQMFPVLDFDGHTIPFADDTFDAVFSSNVLEHIPHLGETFAEIRRVLRAKGIAVHVLPTPIWRTWTTLMHYPTQLRRLPSRLTALGKGVARGAPAPPQEPEASVRENSARRYLLRALGLAPHGEYANAIAELYYFSRRRWEREFKAQGFRVLSHAPAGTFYTGHLFVSNLSLETRKHLAALLGSACHVFVTAPLNTSAMRRAWVELAQFSLRSILGLLFQGCPLIGDLLRSAPQ